MSYSLKKKKATALPIAAISYNSEEFLYSRLKEMRESGVLRFWAFIKHRGEHSSDPNKPSILRSHIHLYLEPNGLLEIEDFFKEFWEIDNTKPFDPEKGDKNYLKCIDPRRSDFENWYLYSIHNKAYLKKKHEEKEFFYSFEDVVTDCPEALSEMVSDIDFTKYEDKIALILSGFEKGLKPFDLIKNGLLGLNETY